MAEGTGHLSYARYDYESTFKTSPGDSALVNYFGHNVRFSATSKNNTERIFNLNTRNATKYIVKRFEGTFTVEFDVSNFYFLTGILGTVADAGAGPFTHTYTEAALPPSATIQVSEELGATDSETTYLGCVFNSLTLTMNEGEKITGRIEGVYADEDKDSTLNANGNAQDSEEVFSFAHASIEWPNATVQTLVTGFESTITNNAELLYALGTRLAASRVHKQRDYTFHVSKYREADADIKDRFYGSTTAISDPNNPADTATLEYTITNGLASTSERSLVALFDSVQFENYNMPVNPNEALKEDADLFALNLNSAGAIYTNNTATAPA